MVLWAAAVGPLVGLGVVCVGWTVHQGHLQEAWSAGVCTGVAVLVWVAGMVLRTRSLPPCVAGNGAPVGSVHGARQTRQRRLAVLCHGTVLIGLVAVTRFTGLGLLYVVAVCAAAALLAYEHFGAGPGSRLHNPVAMLWFHALIAVVLLLAALADLLLGVRQVVSGATWQWFL